MHLTLILKPAMKKLYCLILLCVFLYFCSVLMNLYNAAFSQGQVIVLGIDQNIVAAANRAKIDDLPPTTTVVDYGNPTQIVEYSNFTITTPREEESSEHLQEDTENKGSPETHVRSKLMFFKTHKCGTSSLVSMIYLYGIRRNLNFLLTPYEHQFFNDRSPQVLAGSQHYDILCQHHRSTHSWDFYKPWIVHPLLPKEETFYFTILRDPTFQFVSNFEFYKHGAAIQEKNPDADLDTVLEIYFDGVGSGDSGVDSVICNRVVNPMSFDLGFTRFWKHSNQSLDSRIHAFVEFLDAEFDFVMITDRFDESLVLLRLYLGWDVEDIVYMKRMTRELPEEGETGKSEEKKPSVSDTILSLLKKHNRVDYQVYRHFHKKLREKLKTLHKRHLMSDLDALKKGQTELVEECLDLTKLSKSNLGTVFHPLSEKGKQKPSCRLWSTSDIFVSKALAAKQDPTFSRETPLKRTSYNTIVSNIKLFESIRLEFLGNNTETSR